MSDVDTEISQLKMRVNDAQRAKMLAELKHQQAKQAVESASSLLREKFGVTSLEEAKKLLLTLKANFEGKQKEVSQLMDRFEEEQ